MPGHTIRFGAGTRTTGDRSYATRLSCDTGALRTLLPANPLQPAVWEITLSGVVRIGRDRYLAEVGASHLALRC